MRMACRASWSSPITRRVLPARTGSDIQCLEAGRFSFQILEGTKVLHVLTVGTAELKRTAELRWNAGCCCYCTNKQHVKSHLGMHASAQSSKCFLAQKPALSSVCGARPKPPADGKRMKTGPRDHETWKDESELGVGVALPPPSLD